MLAIRLPPDIESRLEILAKQTGRSLSEFVEEAVVEHLDDLEDLHLAERALADIRAGRAGTVTLDEVERELGLED
jgi:RHH-type rel operon transcriptional repressor/antitoxin RelB